MTPGDDERGESFASLFESGAAGTPARRRLRAGERLEVTIVAIGRDGVFADIGGKQEGSFERIELADKDGRLTVSVGSRVSAVVTEVDEARGQVKLSPVFVRRTDEASDVGGFTIPRAPSGPILVEGAVVSGKVTGVERYGVFVQIDGTSGRGGRGLVPASETATPRNSDLKKQFPVGTQVVSKILSIAEDGKIRLSIAAAGAEQERGEFEAYRSGAAAPAEEGQGSAPEAAGGKGKKKPQKPEPKNFGTLGDLLSKKKLK
jgi:small subunit ribosomal protein S1